MFICTRWNAVAYVKMPAYRGCYLLKMDKREKIWEISVSLILLRMPC